MLAALWTDMPNFDDTGTKCSGTGDVAGRIVDSHAPIGRYCETHPSVGFGQITVTSVLTGFDRTLINAHSIRHIMTTRTMPVCFTMEQYKIIEAYARKKGMLNASQALEDILYGR